MFMPRMLVLPPRSDALEYIGVLCKWRGGKATDLGAAPHAHGLPVAQCMVICVACFSSGEVHFV